MKLDHLGDAFDFWKGGVLKTVKPICSGPYVIPMLTDPSNWTRGHFRLYAEMLGVPEKYILFKKIGISSDSTRTFFSDKRLKTGEDLFVDPNTGIARIKTRARKRDISDRILTREVLDLLGYSESRVLIIYRHSREPLEILCENLQSLRDKYLADTHMFACCGAGASIVFISGKKKRLRRFLVTLKRTFGPVRKNRLTGIV